MKRKIFTACMALAAVALLVIAVVLPGCNSDEPEPEPNMQTARFQLSSFEGRLRYDANAQGFYQEDDETYGYSAKIVDSKTDEIVQVCSERPSIPYHEIKDPSGMAPEDEPQVYETIMTATCQIGTAGDVPLYAQVSVWAEVSVSSEGREVTKVTGLEQYPLDAYNLDAAGIYLVDDELPTTSLQVQIHGMARPLGSGEKDAPDFEDFPYKADVVFEMVQDHDKTVTAL